MNGAESIKIVFISNFYNHHQASVSRKLYQLTKKNYRFVSTTEMPTERKKLGYSLHTDDFVVSYASEPESVMELIDAADVVVYGSAPHSLLNKRIKDKKLVFKYSEPILKKGFQWWKYPIRLFRLHRNIPITNKNMYLLCAGASTAKDYAKFGLFRKKTYKWGYFPECKRYTNINDLVHKKNSRQILWCGRFLDWKHPDDVLVIASRLKAENYDFRINFIGTGDMELSLHGLAKTYGLDDYVHFCGSMSPEKVREYMEISGIFLFTSDRKEGWGAVLNEAMNSGCAVVASDAAGSSPFLVNDGQNGFLYASGNIDELFEKVKYLLDRPSEQGRFGIAAYNTIVQEWNADIAGERLYRLAQQILSGEEIPDLYESGPCSKA